MVAKGYTYLSNFWAYGVDFFETFSLVAKLNSIRVLISVAVKKPLYHVSAGCEECFLTW